MDNLYIPGLVRGIFCKKINRKKIARDSEFMIRGSSLFIANFGVKKLIQQICRLSRVYFLNIVD